MEIQVQYIAAILKAMKDNGYFDSNSLDDAIVLMKKDPETSFSLSIQMKNLDIQEQVLLNELIEKAMNNE